MIEPNIAAGGGQGAQHVLGIEHEFLPSSSSETYFKGNTGVTFIVKEEHFSNFPIETGLSEWHHQYSKGLRWAAPGIWPQESTQLDF